MSTMTIPWSTGTGYITLHYEGHGNETVSVGSDENTLDVGRSQNITIKSTDGTSSVSITVEQAAGPNFRLSDGEVYKTSDGNYYNVLSD